MQFASHIAKYFQRHLSLLYVGPRSGWHSTILQWLKH